MSKKLAIAMFGQKRLSREGGVEIVVKELCTRMAQNGCDVTCYNRAGHHVSGAEYDDAGKTEYEGIRQKSVPTIERRGLAAVSSSAFAALYSAFGKYDVVHIHAEGPAFFAWLPKMFGKRVVVTVHGIDWQREKWQSGLGSKFIHQGEKNAAKYADEVIVLSKGVQDYFKETYGRKTHFIPNGVNRPQIREAKLIKDHFGLEKDSYILFLGRLVPEKGIRYLVEAFKNVKTDKKLVIAGGSSDTDSFMEELKELAKGDDGQTKLEGELAVSQTLEKYFIVRIAWVFGLNGKNFIKTMLNVGKTHDTVRVVNDQIGTPTYTYDLARLLVDMNETEKYGYYHATNEGGYISWYDFTKEIYRQAGYKTAVLPVSTEEYGLSKAARPFNSRLDKSKLVEAGFTPLPTWQDALSRYLKEIEQ